MTDALELTLQEATTDGIAYFIDSSGNEYFRPRKAGPTGKERIRPLIHGHDNHPMMYQFSRRNPLAEIGRKFASIEEAEHYVAALHNFDRMIRLADIAGDATTGEGLAQQAFFQVRSLKELLKKDSLDVLETIPGFDSVRKYLDMQPSEIHRELTFQGTPTD